MGFAGGAVLEGLHEYVDGGIIDAAVPIEKEVARFGAGCRREVVDTGHPLVRILAAGSILGDDEDHRCPPAEWDSGKFIIPCRTYGEQMRFLFEWLVCDGRGLASAEQPTSHSREQRKTHHDDHEIAVGHLGQGM